MMTRYVIVQNGAVVTVFGSPQPVDTAGYEELAETDALWVAYLLAQAQAAQTATLMAVYETASIQPVSYTTKAGVSHTFQADASSQQLVQTSLAGYSAAQAVPSGFYWVAADNTQVPFVYADLQGLAGVMIAQGWTAFQQLQTLKAEVRTATTVAAVQAVVWP